MKMKFIMLSWLFVLCSGPMLSQKTYLHCGQIIDVVKGVILKNKTIIIDRNIIVDILDGYAPAPASALVIDLKKHTIMPGWIFQRTSACFMVC